MKLDLKKGEILLKEGRANHWKGIEAVGGRLFLTDHRLVFKPHSFNIQIREESISLDQIVSIKPNRTFFILPNQISVELANGKEERFVVWNRKKWMEKIEQIKKKMPQKNDNDYLRDGSPDKII